MVVVIAARLLVTGAAVAEFVTLENPCGFEQANGAIDGGKRDMGVAGGGAAVFVTGITGLTLNGAIHDLGLGSPGSRFPLVLLIAALVGIGSSFAISRILRRLFPPVTGVTWNEPGLEGSIAQIVTATAGAESPGGRARVRDAEGIVHVVRVHAPGGPLRFGRRVRLGPFDDTRRAYPAEPV